MKKGSLKVLLVCLMVSFASPAMAENTQVVDKERIQASHELFDTLQMDKLYNSVLESTVELQIKQRPQMAKYRDVFYKFFSKYMSWNSIKDEVANLYASEFTANELKDITAFYKTPTGQKAMKNIPALMNKAGEIGIKHVNDHRTEFEQMLEEAFKKKK